MAIIRAVGVAWFRPEDYQRIRDISDDEMQPTFEDFEAKMARNLPKFEATLPPGVIIEKIVIDPDELLAFARQFHGGKIRFQSTQHIRLYARGEKARNRSLS